MFRTVVIGAGLVLAPGRFGTDATRSRTRTPRERRAAARQHHPPRRIEARCPRHADCPGQGQPARCPPPHGVIGREPRRRPGPPALPTLPRRQQVIRRIGLRAAGVIVL